MMVRKSVQVSAAAVTGCCLWQAWCCILALPTCCFPLTLHVEWNGSRAPWSLLRIYIWHLSASLITATLKPLCRMSVASETSQGGSHRPRVNRSPIKKTSLTWPQSLPDSSHLRYSYTSMLSAALSLYCTSNVKCPPQTHVNPQPLVCGPGVGGCGAFKRWSLAGESGLWGAGLWAGNPPFQPEILCLCFLVHMSKLPPHLPCRNRFVPLTHESEPIPSPLCLFFQALYRTDKPSNDCGW